MTSPACRHADGTISSSHVLDVWRMVSEDSDELVPGFPSVHRLRDLRYLDQTLASPMSTIRNQLHAVGELLEIELLRGAERMPSEEWNDRLQQILSTTNDVAVEMLPVV